MARVYVFADEAGHLTFERGRGKPLLHDRDGSLLDDGEVEAAARDVLALRGVRGDHMRAGESQRLPDGR